MRLLKVILKNVNAYGRAAGNIDTFKISRT